MCDTDYHAHAFVTCGSDTLIMFRRVLQPKRPGGRHARQSNERLVAVSSGTGVTLDGTNDYVDLAAVPLGGAMSISLWVRLHTFVI